VRAFLFLPSSLPTSTPTPPSPVAFLAHIAMARAHI
jgi:hypothetical protein